MKKLICLVLAVMLALSVLVSGYSEGIKGDGTITSEFFILAYNRVIEQFIQQFINDEEQRNAYVTMYQFKRDSSKDTDEMAVFTSFAGYEIYGYYQNINNGITCDKFEYVAKLDNPFPDWEKGENSYLLNALLIYNFLELSLAFGNSDTEQNQKAIWQWIFNNQRETYAGDKFVLDYNYDLDGYSHFRISWL